MLFSQYLCLFVVAFPHVRLHGNVGFYYQVMEESSFKVCIYMLARSNLN